MTNSHAVCLVLALYLITGCVSDDDSELGPDAAPPPSCEMTQLEVTARRLCTESCDAARAATGCSPDSIDDFDVACLESCIATPIPADCVDEAARHWVCLSQQAWVCSPAAQKPAPMDAAACLLTADVLAECVKGDGS